ncbi:class I SAM-dependent methyltransferase [Phenylobacterium sp. 20VBR1]|uniref:Class I SAM-dependent methyltransferase n=1 Tax=Phenylobacterium glaciei TaxID=2803784 RepID=A0A941HW54_9CAUL|nr:class I SAM-dependent methyltransferase [Phenylobacterium glaciei]MBR7619443.1 class I SAM-dependent methyltransferase [Phenylobacterium glaciei]
MHRAMRSILDTELSAGSTILVVGAGGGRELQTLGASPANYRLVGVDPSAELLSLAKAYVAADHLDLRTTLVEGVVDNLTEDPVFDAATALFVMHFLPDDGSKLGFLTSIRKRLKPGAPYIHVDVCFDNAAMYERMEHAYARHAILGGLAPDAAADVASKVGAMPIVSETVIRERLTQSGFKIVAPFYRGLWYAGWWAEAQ